MKEYHKKQGDVIQLIGTVIIGIGVGCELSYGADLWLVVITIGSVMFAIGTKIKGV